MCSQYYFVICKKFTFISIINTYIVFISYNFVYINKYIWAGVKRLKDPKIVKEKVEVEVEKIIEKPIFKDKVVYVDQEVPRETIIEKKEMVYVPLPTDDEELLKKGPFKAPDYDKDKKK